jgi:hypothetical protein
MEEEVYTKEEGTAAEDKLGLNQCHLEQPGGDRKAAESAKGGTTLHAKGHGGAEGQEAGTEGLIRMGNVVARRGDEGQEG